MEPEPGGAANCPQHKSAPSPVGSVSSWRRSSTLRPLSPPRTAPRIVPTGSDGQGPCKTGLCRVSAPSSDSLMPVAHTTLVFIRMRSCTAQGAPAKRPRSCPWRPGPLRAPRRAPELRYSKAKRPATAGSNSRCIAMDIALCAARRQRCGPRRALLAGLGGIWGGQLHSVMQSIIWADEAAASLRKSDAAGPSLSVRSPSPPTLAAQSAAGELG